MESVEVYNNDVPAIADDFLIAVADQAEKRVDAVMKIKRVALKVTNGRDWTDQNGNPYLQVSGSEKIANLFNISWKICEPEYQEEPDGHFMYSIKGTFSLGGRTIEVQGTRSSKDPFFNRYEYIKVEGKPDKEKRQLPPSKIDKGDVKKAALTNLYGNGITRILGIRNLTWSDLEEFAGIKKETVGKVEYKNKGENNPPLQQPGRKSEAKEGQQTVITSIFEIASKKGTSAKGDYCLYTITGEEKHTYKTFSDTFADIARSAKEKSEKVQIAFTSDKYGNNIAVIEPMAERERQPGEDPE